MKFRAVQSVAGRISTSRVYYGAIVSVVTPQGESQLRIAVYDDTGAWMTFQPHIFVPSIQVSP